MCACVRLLLGTKFNIKFTSTHIVLNLLLQLIMLDVFSLLYAPVFTWQLWLYYISSDLNEVNPVKRANVLIYDQ